MLSEHDVLAQRAEAGRRQADRFAVRAAMSTPAIVIGPDDDVGARRGEDAGQPNHCLPVVDEGGAVIGVISTPDIVRHEASRTLEQLPTGDLTAAEVTTREPVSVRPPESFLNAVAMMLARNIRHLPVTDASGHVVGMLSDRDVRTVAGDPAAEIRLGAEREDSVGNLEVGRDDRRSGHRARGRAARQRRRQVPR